MRSPVLILNAERAVFSQLSMLSARDLAHAIRKKQVSAVAAVEASLGVIASADPDLHCFITIDAEGARRQAKERDTLAASGRWAGPLHGVPFAVKDLIATAGLRTTQGSQKHVSDVPLLDDFIVARLRSAGAVLVGKTNTPEFGFGALCSSNVGGNTRTPYALDRTSGGSSGGAAAAVATGMVSLSLGTDFGGSSRTPAAFCGVVGFRPSAGLVAKTSKSSLWETMATYGTLTRTVADARLMISVMAGSDPRDPASIDNVGPPQFKPPTAPRLAASLDLGIATISAEIAEPFRRSVAAVGERFGPIANICPDFTGAQNSFEMLRAGMLFHDFARLLDDPELSPTVRWNIERGRGLSSNDWLNAEAVRYGIYQNCIRFFNDIDFLLLPTTSVAPWPLDQSDVLEIDGKPLRNIVDYLTITYAISLVGLPAISIPCGWTDSGLPVGMQIVAGPRQDFKLLAFAEALESNLGFCHVFPETRSMQI